MLENRNTKLLWILVVITGLLITRLFSIQIVEGKKLARSASLQRTENYNLEKPRGDILDRNLIPFTNRTKKYSIVLKPFYLREDKMGLEKLCEILDLDYQEITNYIETEREPLFIDADKQKKDIIMDMNIKGISLINSLKRYDDSAIAKHIMGYLNKVDQVGQTGLERAYNHILEYDREDLVGVIIDAQKNFMQGLGYRILKREGSTKEFSIKLTLDYYIQRIVEDVLNEKNIAGAVIVQDVVTGEILAISSKPDFDQNEVKKYLDSPKRELFNRAVASYNLGSIFKIIDASILLESENEDIMNEKVFCPGFIEVGNQVFKCSSYGQGGHGLVDLKRAFADSCNTYFITMGLSSGYESLIETAHKFGLGELTGIASQGIGEARGNLPDTESYYSSGDIANISIGQGDVMATPLQIVNIISTIANGGIKNAINIVDSVVDEDGNSIKDLKIRQGERIILKQTADRIKTLMEEVTNSGTGTRAKLEEFGGAAGKTGSAETGKRGIVHAWFAGYFPQNDPRYSMVVFVENGQYGGSIAAPIFADIASEIMKKGF